ncbi:MAG: fatty acid desaturase [Cyanobacteria bacterium J06648_1]
MDNTSSKKGEVDVREELAKLGKDLPLPFYILLQAFLTWMTGKPYCGQQPLFVPTRFYQLMTTLLSLFGGAMGSIAIWNSSPLFYPLLLVSWSFTVGGARKIQTCINHRCIHRQFFGDQRDRWLADGLSTILLTQDFEGYYYDHIKLHHHYDYFATFDNDPDADFLWHIGFRPGLRDKAEDKKKVNLAPN